jgi:hypothetical protein
MPYVGTDWSLPPRPEQLEFTLIGPGFGETAIVHLGAGRWLIIDSCIEIPNNQPAALSYLSDIGVDPATAVSLILATTGTTIIFAALAIS